MSLKSLYSIARGCGTNDAWRFLERVVMYANEVGCHPTR
jgi:hypothetical protein